MQIRPVNISTVSSGQVGNAAGVILWNVNVNTASAGSILKLYNNTSAVAADIIATIDCGSLGSYWYAAYCSKGLFYAMSVAAADVTIGYS